MAESKSVVIASLVANASHTYGSRVVDGAPAAALDADGATELLAPTAARDALAAVRRTGEGAAVVWRKPLDGPLRSNVPGVTLPGGVAVGAGTDDGVVVWEG